MNSAAICSDSVADFMRIENNQHFPQHGHLEVEVRRQESLGRRITQLGGLVRGVLTSKTPRSADLSRTPSPARDSVSTATWDSIQLNTEITRPLDALSKHWAE
ncbi:hypothetical protein IscW_ISCW000172 [Ixodes scapularis]|uniref:Uncharacterized protein n=1 Tax=Ixodes scapularis TaxID=6945 RepID=B7P3U4_IXOSC|nr:hypothetical protein IscW_ISCW000172 [Ixodes scapularis]|eukprot:XP_002404623.1 hypothetical protein IscW_ISCW000172 [Ixodes scapularis]